MISSSMPELTRHRLLSQSEESRLIRLAQAGDITARNKIIESNMRLVIALTKSYSTSGVDIEDLIQEGIFGIIKAIEKFNSSLGHKFSTYATPWIKQVLGRVIDNKSRSIRLPAYVNDQIRKISKAQNDLGGNSEEDDLAVYLEMTPGKLHKIMSSIPTTVSLEDPIGTDLSLGALLEDEGAGDPLNYAIDASERSTVLQALSMLNVVERKILLLKLDNASYDDVYKSTGISRDRIKSLESTAIRKLADAARTRCLSE
jgi:RNA polymerase primary sigma factor